MIRGIGSGLGGVQPVMGDAKTVTGDASVHVTIPRLEQVKEQTKEAVNACWEKVWAPVPDGVYRTCPNVSPDCLSATALLP